VRWNVSRDSASACVHCRRNACARWRRIPSGREEARLIYLGVAHGMPQSRQRRLVIDIGGGSTEFIIGQGFEPLETESVQMGCIASTLRFFGDGKISAKRWRQAQTDIALELQQFAADYRSRGWGEAIGSSGTAKAIGNIVQANGWCEQGITASALGRLRDAMIEAGSIDNLRLAGLAEERVPVIAGGVLILEAAFATFAIEQMNVCETAMREGLLYDMVGRAMHGDPRSGSIAALALRYGVDRAQAARPTMSPTTGSSARSIATCSAGARTSTRSAWRSRTACIICTARTSSPIPTWPASVVRDSRRWRRSSARTGASLTATASTHYPSACAALRAV